MGKLTEMAVGRVDGVDKPAIRKRWVLVKSEDATPVEKDYAGAARAAIEAIAKEGVEFSDETVEVLRTLVEMLELDVEFAAKSEESDESDESGEDESGDGDESDESDESGEGEGDESESDEGEGDEVEKTYTAEEAEALVAKALQAAGVDPANIVKRAETTSLRPVAKTRQPKVQDGGEETVRKSVFGNVVSNKPSEPYAGRR